MLTSQLDPAYLEVASWLALSAKTAKFGLGYSDLKQLDPYEVEIIRLVIDG